MLCSSSPCATFPMAKAAHSSASPLSAESNFRQLDDAFLQTQTRIWLGEVLQTSLNESLDISDLLADGELLFEVSRVVWKMLLTTHMELRHIKAYSYESFAYGKSSRSYLPYSNVDTFLKICKILGLTGIDLFSPSDVVEKKNTRKVCMCIRLLSKKARSKQLNVPDFDVVTCTVAMPKDMVGCIRRSLEQSRHIFPSTASQNSNQVLTTNHKKRNSIPGSYRSYGLCNEEYDDSEYKFIIQSDGSPTNCLYDDSSQVNFYLLDSPGVSAIVGNRTPEHHFSPVKLENQEQNEYTHKIKSLCSNESAGSCCSLGEDDYQLHGLSSSSCVDSPIHFGPRVYRTKSGSRRSYEIDTLDFSYCGLAMQIGPGEGSAGDRLLEKINVPFVSISNIVCHEIVTGDSIQFDGDDSIFKGYTSPSSHGSNSTPSTSENGFRSKLADVNDEEVYSTTCIISSPDIVQNLDFDDQLDAVHDFRTLWLPELQSGNMNDKAQNIIKCQKLLHCSTANTEKPPIDIELIDGFKTKLFQPCSDTQSSIINNSDHGVVYDNQIFVSLNSSFDNGGGKCSHLDTNCLKNVHCDQCLELAQSYSPFDFHLWDQKGKCAVVVVSDENDGKRGNRGSLYSVSLGGLQGEIDYCRPDEARGGALVHEEVIHFAMVVSDQPNNCFQTTLPNIMMDIKYRDSKVLTEPRSTNYGYDLQHQDVMITDNTGQTRHILGRVSMNDPSVHNNLICHPNSTQSMPDKRSCSTTEALENVGCLFDKTDRSTAENVDKVHGQDDKYDEVEAVENSERTDDPGMKLARHKSHRRLLLKSVVRGTAFLGVLFVWLHLRKNGRERTGEPNLPPDKIRKENGMKLSLQKGQKEVRVNGLYPAMKLGLE